MNRLKITVGTLALGEKFKHDVKYGQQTLHNYCKKHNYTLVDDESVIDSTRPLPWSKVKLIQKYLSSCDYFVWIDADTVLMNDEIKLEDFIQRLMGDKELMYVSARKWVNTGVMFIKNTEYMHKFFEEVWLHTQQICWEQGSIDYLWRCNWENCQNKIVIVPDNREFNSDWFQYRHGQFLVHFPGCGEPNRPQDCLKKMIALFCPIRMEEDTNESYNKRVKWLKERAHIDLSRWKLFCDKTNRYFPLDLPVIQ